MGQKLRLTVACGDYEIVRALKEGTVKADGLELVMLTGMGPRERHWRSERSERPARQLYSARAGYSP